MRYRALAAISLSVLLFGWANSSVAAQLTTLYKFSALDGSAPRSSLVMNDEGAIFGTTYAGAEQGTVFRLRRGTSGNWVHRNLHDFGLDDEGGRNPIAGLAIGANGSLFGTTQLGFAGVFRLRGTDYTVLHQLSGPDGSKPAAGLVIAPDGTMFGTTYLGGEFNLGTVFRIRGTNFKMLHSFSGPDGSNPYGDLVMAPDGTLYGTAQKGGSGGGTWCPSGCGTVFKLSPVEGTNRYRHKVLYRFVEVDGCADGCQPNGGMVIGADGALYGTTQFTVFKLTPPGPGDTRWKHKVLYRFSGPDGANPLAGLLLGTEGALYGTTSGGGAFGGGTVFKLLPPLPGTSRWRHRLLYSFSGPDGAEPVARLIQDEAGALYGTTASGGNLHPLCASSGCGTVFKLVQ